MYLEFDKIRIQDFKTFTGEPVTLHLTDKTAGLRFIRGRNEVEPDLGSNGAAKSSLFDALSWCLWGQTVSGLKTPDIIPWHGDGPPDVTTTLYVSNRRHTVRRSAQPNKLLIDDKEADQTAVNELLGGINFLVGSHTVILGQGQPLFFDLPPKDKMQLFSTTLNMDRWEVRAEKASSTVKALEKVLDDFRAAHRAKDSTLAELERLQKTAKAKAEEWDDERKDRDKKLQAEITDAEERLEKLAKRNIDADLARDSAGAELKALEKEIASLVKARDEAQADHQKVELALEGIEDIVAALKKELAGLTGKGDACPTCGQSLKGTALARHKAELTRRVEELEDKLEAGVPKAVTLRLKRAVDALAKANTDAETFRERVETAQTTLNVVVPEIGRLEGQLRILKDQQKERDETINPHREEVTTLRKKINTLNDDLDKLEDEIDTNEKLVERIRFWVKGFKDIRLHLLEELLEELELATNALLPESGLHNWSVHYDIERETKKGTFQQGLNVFVRSPHNKKPVKWECWSGGESNRLRVVGALALAEVLLSHAGVQTNLEVLDEPTRDLSIEGVQDLCEYLADRAHQLEKDIWFVDHMAVESRHFTDIVTVVRTKAGSHLEK